MHKSRVILYWIVGGWCALTPFVIAQSVSPDIGFDRAADDSLGSRMQVVRMVPQAERIHLTEGAPLRIRFTGAPGATRVLSNSLVIPQTVIAGDFDEDGRTDLVCGYTGPGGGVMALFRGRRGEWKWQANEDGRERGEESAQAFSPTAKVFLTPESPDLLVAGDFNADGHEDLAYAQREGATLHFLFGNGGGEFPVRQDVVLNGKITAMVAGDINRADGLPDVVVAVEQEGAATLYVFEGPEGAARSRPELIPLADAIGTLALGQLDDEFPVDIVAVGGRTVYLVQGRDRRLSQPEAVRRDVPSPVIVSLAMSERILSVAIGDFMPDLKYRSEIAALDESGTIHLLSPDDDLPGQGSTETKYKGMSLKDTWQSARPFLDLPADGVSLFAGRISGMAGDDLLIVSPAERQVRIASCGSAGQSRADILCEGEPLVPVASLVFERAVVSVLPLRLNDDALSDLVILREQAVSPTIVTSAAAQMFTVTTTADSGPGSLRQAILDANSNPGPDLIQFAIPGTGIPTIAPRSPLPDITDAVTIDGTTQPAGLVEISGAGAGQGVNGLTVRGGNSVLRGLVINRYTVNLVRLLSGDLLNSGGSAIVLSSANNIVEGNLIGTDAAGQRALGNGLAGIVITGPQNLVGGTTAKARNVISGNMIAIGIATATGRQNRIQGNFLGTDLGGSVSIANSGGVVILGGVNNIIGGPTAAERNVISGNTKPLPVPTLNVSGGIAVGNLNTFQGATGNLIQGNFIGTTATGTGALGNGGPGVFIGESPNNTVGGTARGARNVISANRGEGVQIYGSGASGNLVQGNLIGVSADGSSALGNGAAGVLLTMSASRNLIGGTAEGAANIIAFNGGSGVVVESGSGNSILSNSIFSNGGLGIDLGGDGVTPNDGQDLDGGANNLQNFPTITSATFADATATIRGALTSTPNTGFRLDLFTNSACDPSGSGEGERMLTTTSLTTDGTGTTNFFVTVSLTFTGRQFITATVTSPTGDTSEFSNCIELVPIRPRIAIVPGALDFGLVRVGQAKTLTLTVQNVGTAPLTVTGMTSDSLAFTVSGVFPPFTLSVQASLTVTVQYIPPDRNEHSGQLTITSNDPERSRVLVGLKGRGAEGPKITVQPDSLDFGNVAVGESSERQVTVANGGDLALTVSAVEMSSTLFAVISPPVPFTVAPGDRQVMTLGFTPSSVGPQSATARITSNDAAMPAIVLRLAGTGVQPIRRLSVSPASLDFGRVAVGQSADQVLTLTNTGNATLVIEQVTISDSQFALQSPAFPLSLRPGAEVGAVIRFTPRAGGRQSALLTIRSNDSEQPTVTLPLSGEGVFSPAFEVVPSALDFGMVGLGQSVDRPVTIYNRATMAVRITATSDNPRFVVSSPALPLTVAAGAEQVVLVRFTPMREGRESGMMSFVGDDPTTTTVTISLSGEGLRIRMLSVPDVEGVAGGVVTLAVALSDGTNISALRFTVEFDPAVLSITNPQAIVRGGAIPADFEFSVNAATRGRVTVLILPPLQYPVPTLPSAGGVVALIALQIAATVPDGSTTTVFFSDVSASDPEANSISVQTQNGRVRISNVRPGDVNLDGRINAQDLISLIRHLTGESPLTGNGLKAADVNCDGRVNEQDAVRLIQHLAGARPLPERCP